MPRPFHHARHPLAPRRRPPQRASRTRAVAHGALLATVLVAAACGASGARAGLNARTSIAPSPGQSTGAPATGSTVPQPGTSAAPATTPAPTTVRPPTTARPPASAPNTSAAATDATSTASAGGLTVSLTVSPARAAPGAAVRVTLSAREVGARGALSYQVSYGDGSTAQVVTPQFCTALPSARADSWALSHTYASVGTYQLSATVSANCTPDRATASVAVTVA